MGQIKDVMQEKQRKKLMYIIITIVAVCVAIGAIIYMISYKSSLKNQEDAYESLRPTEVVEIEMETQAETENETEEQIVCEAVYDFEELRKTNEDIYAWITIPGTKVDYPVLQSEEDNYYLDKNLDHSTGYPGCIYTNKCNLKSFNDMHTILYGHNMKNDSMFGSLHDYESQENFDTNRIIYVYTEQKRMTYEIYGAVKFTDVYIPAVYGVNSKAGNGQFLQDLQVNAEQYASVSNIAEMEVSAEDKLITLSTCISGEDTKRYIIVGVLVEETFYTE